MFPREDLTQLFAGEFEDPPKASEKVGTKKGAPFKKHPQVLAKGSIFSCKKFQFLSESGRLLNIFKPDLFLFNKFNHFKLIEQANDLESRIDLVPADTSKICT